VATGGGDRDAVILWDPKTGQELLVLAGSGDLTQIIRFSPDGNSIAAVTWNLEKPVLHLWHAPAWEEIGVAAQRSAVPQADR